MLDPQNIRNVCIIAHVDHGKTTLSDNLLSSNSIINEALAGKLRYLDSREDEQEKEITMKSSSIALLHEDFKIVQNYDHFMNRYLKNNEGKPDKNTDLVIYNNDDKQDYLVNLIDSPGHIEFNFEVTTGLKACDGAILVVDVVEGVCSQTITNLRKAIDGGLSVILVLNKIDKLVSDLGLTGTEAFQHLVELIDSVNAALTGALSAKIIEEFGDKGDQDLLEDLYQRHLFDPLRDNVIFGAAYDGWGFSLDDFTEIVAKNFGFKKNAVKKFLWGEYYFDKKKKKITTKPKNEKQKPMFVQFILSNIFMIYEKIKYEKDLEMIEKMSKKLKIKVPSTYLKNIDNDWQQVCSSLMTQWLPMHRAVLSMVVRKIPNPKISQNIRLNEICKRFKKAKGNKELYQKLLPFKQGIENADRDAPLIAYISKMNHIPIKNVNEMKVGMHNFHRADQNEMKLYAFTRIFSGEIKRGDTVKLQILQRDKIGKKEDNIGIKVQIVEAKINHIYIWMGQYLQGIESAGPGCIVALGDLGHLGFKSVTLSSSENCPSITKLSFEQNLLKVSVKTKDYSQMAVLNHSLKKLIQADPVVEVYYDEKGDLIIECGGEEHLRRCLVDIAEDFESIEDIVVSDPIITFKETIIKKYKLRIRKTHLMVKQQIINENQKAFKEDLILDQQAEQLDEEELKESVKRKQSEQFEEDKIKNPDEINYEKLYRQHSFSSSYFETTSEEEELTEDQKIKLKEEMEKRAIENWYDSDEDKEDATDVRYIYNPNTFKYKEIKEEVLNVTKKNKAVNISKNELVDLKMKRNQIEIRTPNNKYKICVQASGMKEEMAQWLFQKRKIMNKLFNSNKKKPTKKYIQFFKDLETKLDLFKTEAIVKRNIMRFLASFGPSKSGNNILCCVFLKPEDTLIGQYLTSEEMIQNFPKYFDPKYISSDDENQNEDTLNWDEKQNIVNKNLKSVNCDFDYGNLPIMEKYFSDVNIVELKKAIESGFNIATRKGPLCAEEMFGTMFVVEDFRSIEYQKFKKQEARDQLLAKTNKKDNDENLLSQKDQISKGSNNDQQIELKLSSQNEEIRENNIIKEIEKKEKKSNVEEIKEDKLIEDEYSHQNLNCDSAKDNQIKNPFAQDSIDTYGPMSGQLLSTMRQACIESFLGAEPRIVQGMFLCTIFCEQDINSKAFEVLQRRRSKILDSDYQELTNMFIIKALLPINESFGFYEEMMVSTSGRVIPELKFHSWQIIDEDPFYEPKTQDELEEHGEKMFVKNNTRQLIEKIRESKGLQTIDKIVVDADKQDTRAQKR